jgi:hypothetical protein
MKQLTFPGFLKDYVRSLSHSATNSLYKLAAEAANNNPRLREPLFLYALFADRMDILLQATKDAALHQDYEALLKHYSKESMLHALEEHSQALPENFHKVWKSFKYRKNQVQNDNHTKTLMRNKIVKLQATKSVSNYRLYTDLGLNHGNINSFLKHGDCSKVSLETARRAVHYLEQK